MSQGLTEVHIHLYLFNGNLLDAHSSSSLVSNTRDFLSYQTNAIKYGTNKNKKLVADAVNPNCSLHLPDNPLTAQGLATPYQLFATDKGQGPCNESNPAQSAFVQAVIFDPAANTLSAYEPLVIDQGTDPAVVPVLPQLPQGAIVGSLVRVQRHVSSSKACDAG